MDWFGVVFLCVELLVCLLFACSVYNKYGSWRKREWYVPALSILGWVLCFYVVFSLPVDVSMSTDDQECNQPCSKGRVQESVEKCEHDTGLVSPTAMEYIWSFVYWLTFVLTWLVYPVAQTYSDTGEFSARERMKAAIKSNLLLYAIGGVVLVIFLVVYLVQNAFQPGAIKQLPSIAIAAGYLYGLLLLIALLGHGLVSIPQRLWRHANQEVRLKKYQFELVDLRVKLEDSKVKLEKTLKNVQKLSEITPSADPYRKYVDIILSKCPKEIECVHGEGNIEVTYGKLSRLHQKVMANDHLVSMYQKLYDQCVMSALNLEDILDSKGSPGWRIYWSFSPPRTGQMAPLINVVEYFYLCYLEGWMARLISIFCMLLSVVVVWCEFVTPLQGAFDWCSPDLSVFSQLVRIDGLHWSVIQLFVFIPVMYIAVCAYTSLFRLRVFNYYHLVPYKMSNSVSLLFSAAYLCRLITPLAYNYLNMIRYTSTPFLGVMGNVDLVPFFGNLVPTFYPVLLVPFSLATLFNFYGWILKQLRIQQFEFTDNFTNEQIDEGAKVLCQERSYRSSGSDAELERRRSRLPRRGVIEMEVVADGGIDAEEDWDADNEAPSFVDRMKSAFGRIVPRRDATEPTPRPASPQFVREDPVEIVRPVADEQARRIDDEDPFNDFY